MSIPRSKILTCITVPTGGWAWDVDVSNAAHTVTNLTGTVAAGDYYISGDMQSDDLLRILAKSISDALAASAVGGGWSWIWIDSDSHKVNLGFRGDEFVDATGDNDVRLNLSAWASGLCAALGLDTSDVASTTTDSPIFTADWHHAYGWYADEDGQTEIEVVDTPAAFSVQGKSISGKVKTQFFGESFVNGLALQFLERNESGRTKVFSDGVGYGEVPAAPYNRNEPLECWYREAMKGTRFRVYRDGRISTSTAADRGAITAATSTTLTAAGKSWSVEPFEHKGRLILTPTQFTIGSTTPPFTWYINSHTATVLTVPDTGDVPTDENVGNGEGGTFYILDVTYGTYVMDTQEMGEFAARQTAPAIDRYDIMIPLLRYVA